MTDHSVIVAGSGPTGMMLAAELALGGVDVVIVERRADQDLDSSRAGGLFARSIEVLDQRGVADRFLAAGTTVPMQMFGGVALDVGDLPSRHPYVLALPQRDFEPILAKWVAELGVPVLRGRDVVGFAEHDDGIDVDLSDGTTRRAEYLVGCDGGRSTVRKAAGIEFAGVAASTSWMIAEVDMDGEPELGMRHDGRGSHGIGRLPDGSIRLVLTEGRFDEAAGDPDIGELRAALIAVYATDYGLRSARWISRFTDTARQAVAYRHGRVLLAGDAAHVHSPHGGQGLNTGVQDAVNLGWKLAQVIRGDSPAGLLDTYHAERHPVGAAVLRMTMALVTLADPDDRHQALRDTMAELLAMDEPRRRIAAEQAGLDIRYDIGAGHALVGRRMPDIDLSTAGGANRVFELLHGARPVLLSFVPVTGARRDRVQVVEAAADGECVLPVVGAIDLPPAVLIRPDGYVAWAGDPADPALEAAIATWC